MLTYYTTKNLSKLFWSWCSQQQLKDKTIWLYNNSTQKEYSIIFKSNKNAKQFLDRLKKGCLLEDIVVLLNNEGYDGKALYIFLMQNGLIE